MDEVDLVDSYLELYSSLDKPGYAVLVKGAWGAGKTHRITNKFGRENIYYVSLFGLSSQKEIFSAVFLSMFPIKAKIPGFTARIKDALKGTEKFTFAAGGIANGLAEALIQEEVKKDKIIVFDDVERANLSLNEILGCINKYVEHHQCRVIVIAHDEEIHDTLDKTKEKIFGQTLLIKPRVEETLSHFIKTSRSPSTAKEIEKYILPVFLASKCQSLRILRQTIDDCLRLYSCLDKKHILKTESLRILFYTFCSFSISFRDGKINKSDIESRGTSVFRDYKIEDPEKKSNIGKMKDRFKDDNVEIIFESLVLSDEILINTICNGYYSTQEIRSYLEKNYHFQDEFNSPAWMTLLNFDQLEDENIKLALKRIKDEESKLEITDIGDIIHTFCIKCLLCITGEINSNLGEILHETKEYVKKLLAANKLPASTKDAREIDLENQDYAHGHSYWLRDEYKPHFTDLRGFISACRENSLENKYPGYIEEVLNFLKTDIEKFKESICSGPNWTGTYAHLPIMKAITAKKFVEVWLSIPRENWSTVTKSLEYRYNSGSLRDYLSEEIAWLKSLSAEIVAVSLSEVGLARLRIERLNPKVTIPH